VTKHKWKTFELNATMMSHKEFYLDLARSQYAYQIKRIVP